MVKIAVVGFGIAGAILSKQCADHGFEVHVFDDYKSETPSKVAAGILNPLSVSRKKPIWKAKEFAEYAWGFYAKWDDGFTHRVPMRMDILDPREQNDWAGSLATEQGFIRWNKSNDQLFINYTGWIETEQLIRSFASDIEHFNATRITDLKDLCHKFDRVILATGQIEKNQLGAAFRPDIFRPVLGDILEVETETEYAFKHLEGLFIIPKSGGKAILGSTYIHDFDRVEPDPSRAKLLLDKAARQGLGITKIVGHRTAVRPAVYDRMPIVGHIRDNLYAFAGMGSRGLFHAPLAAEMLIQSWGGKEIDPLLNVQRAKLK